MRLWILGSVLLMLVVFSYTQVSGQTTSTIHTGLQDASTSYTLDDCLRLAQTQNYMLIAARLNLEAARKSLSGQEINTWYPKLTLSGSYNRYDDLLKSSSINFTPSDSFSFDVQGSLLLYGGGARFANLAIAKLNEEILVIQLAKAERDVNKAVILGFLGILLQKKFIEISERSLENAEISRSNAETNFDSGLIPEFQYNQILLQYENTASELRRSKESYMTSKNQLLQFIGEKLESSIVKYYVTFVGSITKPAAIELSLEDAILTGLTNRFEIQELEKNVDIMKQNMALVQSGLLPTVTAFGNVNMNVAPQATFDFMSGGITFGSFSSVLTFRGGVSVSLSISDLLLPKSGTWTKIDALNSQIEAMEANLALLKENIRSEIIANYVSLEQARDNIKTNESLVEISVKNFQTAFEKYNNGDLGFLDYQNADLQNRRTEITYYGEIIRYYQAKINLLSSMGQTLTSEVIN